ncbi:MAG: N-acetylneuraminate synthase family protein [Sediminibacterium sp.]
MNSKVSIIAELAQGFEGNFMQARLLVKAAASAGADAAKFQLVFADELATPDYKYYPLFQSLEMNDADWQNLANYAKSENIELYLDIFGTKSLQLSEKIGINCIKLHGTDISNIGLLHEVAASSIPNIMLGAGGAHLSEIKTAIDILKNKKVIVLLGFQGYPTPDETNQVSRIEVMRSFLDDQSGRVTIGFADHADPLSTLRYAIAAIAVGAGATVIEKHLTLGKSMKMEDHESALNPDEFLEFVTTIRNCYEAFGVSSLTEDFGMSDPEKNYRRTIRRHVVAAYDLKKGHMIQPTDLVLKRSSEEDVITDLNSVYGKELNRDIAANNAILKTDIV